MNNGALKKNTTLDKLKKGTFARITQIDICDGRIFRKLIDMGVVSGSRLKISKVVPMYDPVIFEIFGYELCLRKNIAKKIWVECL